MTIDERLGALAQTVELLAGMQQVSERSISQLAAQMTTLTGAMTRLANVVIPHKERLDGIDGGEN